MLDPHSPILNPGLKPNEIASPDNLGVEPIPRFVDNSVQEDVQEEEVEVKKPKRSSNKSSTKK
jgi:hypothetical protein